MQKTKAEKGITLVALIITVVILLILATVTITSIRNTDIIGYVNNAGNTYNQKQEEEKGIIIEYESSLGFLEKRKGNVYVEQVECEDRCSARAYEESYVLKIATGTDYEGISKKGDYGMAEVRLYNCDDIPVYIIPKIINSNPEYFEVEVQKESEESIRPYGMPLWKFKVTLKKTPNSYQEVNITITFDGEPVQVS